MMDGMWEFTKVLDMFERTSTANGLVAVSLDGRAVVVLEWRGKGERQGDVGSPRLVARVWQTSERPTGVPGVWPAVMAELVTRGSKPKAIAAMVKNLEQLLTGRTNR